MKLTYKVKGLGMTTAC